MENENNQSHHFLSDKAFFFVQIFVGLTLSSLCLVIPFFQEWGGHPFSRPDADIIFAYQSLVLGDGGVPEDYTHTGYLYFLIQSYWFSASNLLGFLDVSSVSALMESETPLLKYQEVIFSGRNLSLVIGFFFVLTFYFVVLKITQNQYMTVIFTALFALGEGLSFQTIVLRTELLSSFLIFLSLSALIVSSCKNDRSSYFWLAGAAIFAALAYTTKLQSIFLLAFLPLFSFLIFDEKKSSLSKHEVSKQLLFVVFAITALVTAPAWYQILSQLGRFTRFSYLFAIAVLLYMLMVSFLFYNRKAIGFNQVILAALAVTFGTGVGLSSMFIAFRPEFFMASANPIEHMSRYILQEGLRSPSLSFSYVGELILKVSDHFYNRFLGDFDPLANGQRLGVWIGLVGAIILTCAKKYRSGFIVLFMVLIVTWIQTVNAVRYVSPVYTIYVDPLMYAGLAFLGSELMRLNLLNVIRFGILAFFLFFAIILADRNVGFAHYDWTQPFSNVCMSTVGYLEPEVANIFTEFCEKNGNQ